MLDNDAQTDRKSLRKKTGINKLGDAFREAPSDIVMKNDILYRACPDTLVVGGSGRMLKWDL